MQKIEASLIVRAGIQQVWDRLLTPSYWAKISGAFAGLGARYQAAATGPGGLLAPGADLVIATPRGRPVAGMRVAECLPLQKLELTAADESHWLRSYHLTLTVLLDSPDPDATVVSVSFNAVFLNRTLEVLSLLLPSFVYSGRLKRALAALKD